MLTPVVAERPAQPYVAIRAQVTMQTMDTILQPLQPQVLAWLSERDIPAAGPPFWKYKVIDMDRVLETGNGGRTAWRSTRPTPPTSPTWCPAP